MRLTDWDNIPGFDPEKQEFVRLDTDRWLKDHGVLDEARKQGAKNKPAPEQSEPRTDGIPAKIAAWINQRGRICRQNVSRHLSDLERDLADMENPEELRILQQTVDESRGESQIALERRLDEMRNRLSVVAQERQEAETDFEAFQQENNLRRLPDYSRRKTAIRWVFSAFVVELVVNATTLMEVSTYGLLGSLGYMCFIGVVNVWALGPLMGWAARRTAHVRVSNKISGGFISVLLIGSAAIFNALVGHFRDSMQAVLGDASIDLLAAQGADTFDRFASSWFAFDSFQSALLALLGMIFFTFSARKWWQHDDPYPEYGNRHRKLEEKRKEHFERSDKARRELQGVFDNGQEQLRNVRHELVAKQSRWREHCVTGERIVRDFPTNLAQYQNDLDELLGAYYTANRSQRTDPAPAWFSDRIEVDPEILMPPSFNVPELTSIQSVTDTVDEAIITLQDQLRDSMRQLRLLDSVLTKSAGGAEKGQ